MAAENVDFYSQAAKFKKDRNFRAYFKCCEKAAKSRNASAFNELGIIFEYGLESDGEIIVLKNLTKAIEHYEQATKIDPSFVLAKENFERAKESEKEAQNSAQKFCDAIKKETPDLNHTAPLRGDARSDTPSSLGPSAAPSIQATPEKEARGSFVQHQQLMPPHKIEQLQ